MSDQKRATLVTVNSGKRSKHQVLKTVRLTVNLSESNDDNYPEINYKELFKSDELKQKTVENGKGSNENIGLDPFSENDEDVQRVAKQFESKYGTSNLGSGKKRQRKDEYADIGAGYDENDSFIDNADGYDEMIPPEVDTVLGGFYINCGALDFKVSANKRPLSPSESSDDSSDSSDDSDSNGAPKVNGHSEKKKKAEKKKAKRMRLSTSDDNRESADSHTSDSQSSKPNPTTSATSDSSRDAASVRVDLADEVKDILEDLKKAKSEQLVDTLIAKLETFTRNLGGNVRALVWKRASQILQTSRAVLLKRAQSIIEKESQKSAQPQTNKAVTETPTEQQTNGTQNKASTDNKESKVADRKTHEKPEPEVDTDKKTVKQTHKKASADKMNVSDGDKQVNKKANKQADKKANAQMVQLPNYDSEEAKQMLITELLLRLQTTIEELKLTVITQYKLECEKVQEEKKRLGENHASRRLPKRRWPWSPLFRQLLMTLASLGGERVILNRAMPLFPRGFVRAPTLLRQAGIKTTAKEFKNRAAVISPEKANIEVTQNDPNRQINDICAAAAALNAAHNDKPIEKNDHFAMSTNIGSITITPVTKTAATEPSKRTDSVIRIKSPSVINEESKHTKDDRTPSIEAPIITCVQNLKNTEGDSPNLQLSPKSRAISNHLKDGLKSDVFKTDLKTLKDNVEYGASKIDKKGSKSLEIQNMTNSETNNLLQHLTKIQTEIHRVMNQEEKKLNHRKETDTLTVSKVHKKVHDKLQAQTRVPQPHSKQDIDKSQTIPRVPQPNTKPDVEKTTISRVPHSHVVSDTDKTIISRVPQPQNKSDIDIIQNLSKNLTSESDKIQNLSRVPLPQSELELLEREKNIPKPELIPKSMGENFAKPLRLKDVRRSKGDKCDAVVNLDDSSSDLEVIDDKSDFSEYQHKKLSRRMSQEVEPKPIVKDDIKQYDFMKVMKDLKDLHASQDPTLNSDCNDSSGTNSAHSQKV